jgi:hypothetical protein
MSRDGDSPLEEDVCRRYTRLGDGSSCLLIGVGRASVCDCVCVCGGRSARARTCACVPLQTERKREECVLSRSGGRRGGAERPLRDSCGRDVTQEPPRIMLYSRVLLSLPLSLSLRVILPSTFFFFFLFFSFLFFSFSYLLFQPSRPFRFSFFFFFFFFFFFSFVSFFVISRVICALLTFAFAVSPLSDNHAQKKRTSGI